MKFDGRKVLSALVAILALVPVAGRAQSATTVVPAGAIDSARQAAGVTLARSLPGLTLQASGQGTKENTSTRGRNMVIGAAIGAGAGLIVGELLFGQRMDLPHGPDMLLGAGIGLGIGVGLGALFSSVGRTESRAPASRTSMTVVPVVSPSRKALLLTVPLR